MMRLVVAAPHAGVLALLRVPEATGFVADRRTPGVAPGQRSEAE